MTNDKRISIAHMSVRKEPVVFIDKTATCPLCKTQTTINSKYGFKRPITMASRLRLERALHGKMKNVTIFSDGMSASAYID